MVVGGGGDWTNSTVPRQAWTGRYSIFYLLSSSLHPLPFSFELSRAKSEVRNLSWVFYTLQMSLLRMSLDYRLILTAWKILEIDGQTLLGVGGISSSFQVKWGAKFIPIFLCYLYNSLLSWSQTLIKKYFALIKNLWNMRSSYILPYNIHTPGNLTGAEVKQ